MLVSLKKLWIRSVTVYDSFRRRTMFAVIRHIIADKYLRGEGLEIGALHNPLIVPRHAKVRYVDNWSTKYLKANYPELRTRKLVQVDLVADGETLGTIGDASQDFLIANHFIEHCRNPLMTLREMFRVLRNNGILFVSLPDKRYTFDAGRAITAGEHLLRDYREGPDWSAREHAEEWVRLVLKIDDEKEARRQVEQLVQSSGDHTMHFHAWTQHEILELISLLRKEIGLSLELEVFFRNGDFEVIFVLRKTQPPEAVASAGESGGALPSAA